jgi:hypothetical protein
MEEKQNSAVFQATVHGLRTVPSRGVVQIMIEAPIEQLPRIASICEHGAWLAVARLYSEGVSTPHTNPPPATRRGSAQTSAILCKNPAFWRFIHDVYQYDVSNEDQCADIIRSLCGVKSRGEFLLNEEAERHWQGILAEYDLWQLSPTVIG